MTTTTTVARDAIALRRCREADGPFLRDLYATTREAEMSLVPWTDEEKRTFLDAQFQAQQAHYDVQYPDCDRRVIELDGRPIGRLYVDRSEDEILIVDIALLPGFRGRGIGTMLLREILAEGAAANRPVAIHVERDNPARFLYARLGFHRVDTNGIYHLLEWRP